jgi:hypothetical protein
LFTRIIRVWLTLSGSKLYKEFNMIHVIGKALERVAFISTVYSYFVSLGQYRSHDESSASTSELGGGCIHVHYGFLLSFTIFVTFENVTVKQISEPILLYRLI